MYNTKVILALLSALPAAVFADGSNCQELEGNWYCNNVSAITYNNFGTSGTYNRVIDMKGCKTTPIGYSGPLAPLDEEVSVAFRGPIHLKHFAAFVPASPKSKRDGPHAHGHQHAHLHDKQKRGDQAMTFTMDGKPVTFTADPDTWNYGGAPAATSAPAPAQKDDAPPAQASVTAEAQPGSELSNAPTGEAPAPAAVPAHSDVAAPASPPASSNAPGPVAPGDWTQAGCYNAASQQADGVVFLKALYAPMTYCAADGKSTASSPATLQDVLVPSNQEFTIWTDKKCSSQNGDCGYYNPSVPAYHGWAGTSKAFLFEFSMPSDGCQEGLAPDAPAIWILNAQIPRTDQYGCSCWESGCGEFDLFEVLSNGETRMKSTLHDQKQSLGSSDYFERPLDGTIKAAVIMHEDSATLALLPNSFQITDTLTADQITQILAMPATQAELPN